MVDKSIKLLIILIGVLVSQNLQSQDEEYIDEIEDSIKIRRINFGLKLGIPNVIGGSIEFLPPIFNNKVAPFLDFSGLNIDIENVGTDFSYLEYGANFYFKGKGNGFFISLGRGDFNTDLNFYNLEFNENGQSTIGDASTNLKFNTTNIKTGIKTGGSFFFRFEVGYGFGSIQNTVEFSAMANGISDNFTEEIPPIPGVNRGGILIGNLGFGLSF